MRGRSKAVAARVEEPLEYLAGVGSWEMREGGEGGLCCLRSPGREGLGPLGRYQMTTPLPSWGPWTLEQLRLGELLCRSICLQSRCGMSAFRLPGVGRRVVGERMTSATSTPGPSLSEAKCFLEYLRVLACTAPPTQPPAFSACRPLKEGWKGVLVRPGDSQD